MNDEAIKTIDTVRSFLVSNDRIEFKITSKKEAYPWIEQCLIRFRYLGLTKTERGLILQYLKIVTGYSRAQITRLVTQYVKTGRIRVQDQNRSKFATRYSREDIRLLAETDMFHNNPNGHALKCILVRMADLYCDSRFDNLKSISVSHIYNVRQTKSYLRINKAYTKTKPSVANSIGIRQKPRPEGKPGFLRVDTVHQGDKDGEKGVYHINMIDEVTQFQFVAATPVISESFLIPILKKLLQAYPFIILEFHSDNGSEYINQFVVEMLNKLIIKQTKSRARHTNDNALVEGKNAWTIRKWIGYSFLPKASAAQLNQFYSIFNTYLNYHRPCAFAEIRTDKKGKVRKTYPHANYRTPYEKLKSLPNYVSYLRPDIAPVMLESLALQHSDNQIAVLVQQQLLNIFKEVKDVPHYVEALSFPL